MTHRSRKFSTAISCVRSCVLSAHGRCTQEDLHKDMSLSSGLSAALSLAAAAVSELSMCCRYVFKNLMRDWSQEGAPERTQSYGRICQEAQKQLAGRSTDRPPKILVPGRAASSDSTASCTAVIDASRLAVSISCLLPACDAVSAIQCSCFTMVNAASAMQRSVVLLRISLVDQLL